MRKILVVDGMNLFLRCYAVVPAMNVNGDHVGGVVGMLRSLKSYVRDNLPTQVIVVWDGAGGSAKRRGICKEYKAGRKPRLNREYDFGESVKDSERNLHLQLAMAKRYVDLLGLYHIEVDDIEADDVVGFLCRHLFPNDDKIVVSTDRDFLQLVDVRTIVYSPVKDVFYGSERVLQDFFCLPENFVYLKAIVGDGSDNIKGIKGIGVKTVAKLMPFMAVTPIDLDFIQKFCNEHRDENKRYGQIAESMDVLTLNVQLMQLTSPVISAQSVRSIRHSLDRTLGYIVSELKLSFIRDGLQLTDSDFFNVFKEQALRSRSFGEVVRQ